MIKKNSMLLLGIILGGVIFGGGVYAVTVASSSVSYSNSTSGLSATNVQSAIDELYSKSYNLQSNISCINTEKAYLLDVIKQMSSCYNTSNNCNEESLYIGIGSKYGNWNNGKLYNQINNCYKSCRSAGANTDLGRLDCMLSCLGSYQSTC